MNTITIPKLDGLEYHEDDWDGAPAFKFRVNATTTQYQNNRDNYLRETGSDTEPLTADTLDELYEEMAKYRIRNEVPGKNQWDDHDSVGFDGITITVAETNFDEARLEKSEAWTEHLAKIEAVKQETAAKAVLAQAAREAKVKEDELQLLASLRAKHGV